jgi:3-hydroxyacyl-CoA dehydrogenase
VKNFDGFVLSTDAPNFSVGANLMQLLLAAQDGEWTRSKTISSNSKT